MVMVCGVVCCGESEGVGGGSTGSQGWRIGECVAPGAGGKGIGAVIVVQGCGRDVREGRRVVVGIGDGDAAGGGAASDGVGEGVAIGIRGEKGCLLALMLWCSRSLRFQGWTQLWVL